MRPVNSTHAPTSTNRLSKKKPGIRPARKCLGLEGDCQGSGSLKSLGSGQIIVAEVVRDGFVVDVPGLVEKVSGRCCPIDSRPASNTKSSDDGEFGNRPLPTGDACKDIQANMMCPTNDNCTDAMLPFLFRG